jgi:uncharacterized membrane protein
MAMQTRNAVSSANVLGHPLHPMLITLPIGFWVATLFADLGYWWTRSDGWATAAMWLLGAAIIAAGAAAISGVSDFMGDDRIRALSQAWLHAIGNLIAVLVSLFNLYWRYRYGAAAVLPAGLLLSLAVMGIIFFTGCWGARWFTATASASMTSRGPEVGIPPGNGGHRARAKSPHRPCGAAAGLR